MIGINWDANYVEALTIGDVWRDAILLCVRNGYDYVVGKGSYEGQIRRQLPYVTIVIGKPWTRPLAPIMPEGVPPPTDYNYIENYFVNYLMTNELRSNEQYTYGSYIVPQLPRIIELLRSSLGATNQACIAIGDAQSVNLSDPPCLRVVTLKVVENRLIMSVFFRSWDLFSGFPSNLGGLQLLKEYILQELQESPGLSNLEDGKLIAFSDGLHLYQQYFDLVNLLSIEKIK